MAEPILLVGDIGGTNARFALANASDGRFTQSLNLQCRDYPRIEQALEEYLVKVSAGRPDAICLAAAGPVKDGHVRLTNNHWFIDREELQSAFGPIPVRLINDFEAVAHSLPLLTPQDLAPVGGSVPELADKDNYKVAVLGPGTGLGVAGLISNNGKLAHIVGEGGHVGFSPITPDQMQVHTSLLARLGRVYNEALLSGSGLENVYTVLSAEAGRPVTPLSAQDIFEQSITGADAVATRAVTLFFEALGQVAGDVVLQLGAFDGVFIAGGIVKRYPQLLQKSRFRSGFENKDVHQSLMERIPSALVTHPDPGLLGASQCARELLA